MTDRKAEIEWRKKVRQLGASDETSGPRQTLDPAKASAIRCPITGKLKPRKSPEFRRWEDALAP